MKKRHIKYFLCFVSLGLMAAKCGILPHDTRYFLVLQNNSSQSLNYYLAMGNYGAPMYPDTTLPTTNGYLHAAAEPGETEVMFDSSLKWEELVDSLPSDTLSVYIFDSDTVAKYGWEKVRSDYKVLRRYDLSLDDLKRTNYRINYP